MNLGYDYVYCECCVSKYADLADLDPIYNNVHDICRLQQGV